jgi:hypothetical protein
MSLGCAKSTDHQAIPGDPRPLLKEKEVASLLGLSPRTLQQWRWRGRHDLLRWVQVGRSIRYRPGDVAALVERGSIDAGAL